MDRATDDCVRYGGGTDTGTGGGGGGGGRKAKPKPLCAHGTAVVLDFQCFRDNANEFLIKEACAVDVTTGTVLLHHVARAPFDRDCLTDEKLRESYWLTKHCHGLEWNRGDIPYRTLLDKLRDCLRSRSVVYVKGAEKKDFVVNRLSPADASALVAIDLSDVGCASLATIGGLLSAHTVRCGRHRRVQDRCALANCVLLRNWLLLTAQETHCASPYCCCD